jgi:hypothetical protein
MTTHAFPLKWPAGWLRAKRRVPSRFKLTLTQARDELLRELMRGWMASSVVISSNLALRHDGLPRAGQSGRIDDPGVAVWFYWHGRQRCVACDAFDRAEHNLTAILRTLEATRGITRWGALSMDQAAQIFAALPPPKSIRPWHEVLGVARTASLKEIHAAYKQRATKAHPDLGGSKDAMTELNAAREDALRTAR